MAATTVPTSRVAIVTGAAQGIGEAIALRLADDGFDVVIAGSPRNPERLDAVAKAIEGKGRKTIVFTGDVSQEASIISLVEKTVNELGGLDVMVANAGIFRVKSLLDLSVQEWDETLAINSRSVMLCFKYAAKQMIKQGRGGRIIGIASIMSVQGCPNIPAYSASKFAVRGLAQCAALELREHNITVNTVAPGVIATPMVVQADSQHGGSNSTMTKTLHMAEDTPIGQPADVAATVSYVASREAGFLTGQCLNINGGALVS